MTTERETIEFDVLFVGGGPASLSGAIRLMQLAKEKDLSIEVAVIEKGAVMGAHAVSGAVLNPRALQELIPDYITRGCPIEQYVRGDGLYFLTRSRALRLPMVPRYLHNQGFSIVSQSRLTQWLAEQAESMGVNIFPEFAGQDILYGEDFRTVIGVRTGDKGLDPQGSPKGNFEPGIDIKAKVTVFGEGARGSLMKMLDERLRLSARSQPQVYEIGIKEVIQLPETHYFSQSPANVIHTLGYPLGLQVPGGGFIYQMKDNRIAIGHLTALCYEDPGMDPYEPFIRFKRHPFVADILKGGHVLEQGARTVPTGGYYTLPTLAVDGALLIGASAGFHNTPALKGIHLCMKSGMLAAEAIVDALERQDVSGSRLSGYRDLLEQSWVMPELLEGRNTAQALAMKSPVKWVHLGAQYISQGRGIKDPLLLDPDYQTLKPQKYFSVAVDSEKIEYDGSLYLDKLTGVYLSRTVHREDQPCHLILRDPDLCIRECYPRYGSPCTRFCPAKVYELEESTEKNTIRLKLNPSNCLHCKTCDIKDPYQNINWVCPEAGGGPGYTMV